MRKKKQRLEVVREEVTGHQEARGVHCISHSFLIGQRIYCSIRIRYSCRILL